MPHEDPTPYLFLCNGAPLQSRKKIWRNANSVELSTHPRIGNIEIRIREIFQTLEANLTPLAADLLEIAASVYVADQLAKRTGRKKAQYGDFWYRTMRLECAVREPDFWKQESIVGCLSQMLGFISGDTVEFDFVKNPSPTNKGDYLDFRRTDPNPEGIERVMLFSGGLDSLAGAVHQLFNENRRIALVSHKPVGHVAGLQKSLIEDLTRRAKSEGLCPLPISVWAHKRGLQEKDHTQRTRSFLYVALGAVVARIFDLNAVDFFENGVVSVNLPLARHEFGGRATRTTHPQTLARFQQLLGSVFESDFEVRNEFLWHTKQDVVEMIDRAEQGELIAQSVSCMHTRETSRKSPHCGLCSQCLSRRFATLGIEGGKWDPPELYRNDVMTTGRDRSEERTIAERFVGLAREIELMEDASAFQRKFAVELGRVTPYVPGSPTDVVSRLYDLHHRHAEQTGAVLSESMREHVDAFRRSRLPDSCPIVLAFQDAAGRPPRTNTQDGSAPARVEAPFVPTKSQLLVLQLLSQSDSRMVQVDLEAATRATGCPLSRKTIGNILLELRKRRLIDYPPKSKQGAAILDAGRSLLSEDSTSQ